MAFKRGGTAASEEAKKNQGGGFRKTHFFSLGEGESAVIRYITAWDDILFVDQHASVPTKNKPKGYEGNWPESMPAVCRYDSTWDGKYKECYPCDNTSLTNQWGRPLKPTVRNWALAVLREEVVGTQAMADAGDIPEDRVGKRIGFKNATREVEVPKRDDKGEVVKEGDKTVMETITEPAFVVVNQASSNYFDGLGAMFVAYDQTINDRDYIVRCTGKGKDKAFTHAPLDKTPNLMPGTEKWQKNYLDAIAEAGDSLSLEAIITERASDEFYARFIDPNMVDERAKSEGGSGKGGSAPDVPSSDGNEPDPDRLAALRDRVRSSGGATAPSSSSLADVD